MTSVLPTDLTAQALDAALDGFRASVGAEHVLTDDEQLREFRDPYWFAGWDDYEASAVVQPRRSRSSRRSCGSRTTTGSRSG